MSKEKATCFIRLKSFFMLTSELIHYLEENLKENGDMVVCVFSDCFLDYSEIVLLKIVDDGFYYNGCEEKVNGDYLLLE